MSTEIFLIRSMGALRPADGESDELLQELPSGVILRAEVTQPINSKFRRKFWALLRVIKPHQNFYPTTERLRKGLLIGLGFCEAFTLPDGRVTVEASSMKYHKMKEDEFTALMRRFVDHACDTILPGIDSEDVWREWQEVSDGYQNSLASIESHLRPDAKGGARDKAGNGRAPQVSGGAR